MNEFDEFDEFDEIVELKNRIAELTANLKRATSALADDPTERLIARVEQTLFECQKRAFGIFPDEISQDAVDAIKYFAEDAQIEIASVIRQHYK